MTKSNIDNRTFAQIWSELEIADHAIFYKKVEGLRESSIRCYALGLRTPTGPSLACLVRGLKRIGINVGDGRFLFPEKR